MNTNLLNLEEAQAGLRMAEWDTAPVSWRVWAADAVNIRPGMLTNA